MKFIGYEELEPGYGFPKLKDCLEKEAYPQKERIVHFLQNGEVEFAQVSRARDVFSGELIQREVLVMNSEEFCWSNVLAYYVENYNLRLPEEFETYILSR